MAKQFFNYVKGAFFLFSVTACLHSFGQVCAPVNSDVSMSLNSSVTGQTANDLWEDNCVYFKVAVDEYGISWSFNDGCNSISNSGSAAFSLGIVSNPDVAIIRSAGGAYWPIVVYYNPGDNKYYYQPWKFSLIASPVPTLIPTLPQELQGSDAPTFNGIRVDANRAGDYVIVMDIISSGVHTPRAIAGHLDGDDKPALSKDGMDNYLISDIPVPDGESRQPDIALTESKDAGAGKALITFLTYASSFPWDYIHVETQDFSDVWDGTMPTFSSSNIIGKYAVDPTDGSFLERPRIACSGDLDASDKWIVVWRQHNQTTGYSDIYGMNPGSEAAWQVHNYTNNSEPGFVLNDVEVPPADHKNPCISFGYDSGTGEVAQIAWYGGWSGSPSAGSDGATIIAISVNKWGSVVGCAAVPCFKMVTGSGHDVNYPSIGGKHSENALMDITWWDDDDDDVYNKEFYWCDATYRMSHGNNNVSNTAPLATPPVKAETGEQPAGAFVYPNPSKETVKFNFSSLDEKKNYTMTIVDISGRKIGSLSGVPRSLEKSGAIAMKKLRNNIFVVNVYNGNEIILSQKVVRQ